MGRDRTRSGASRRPRSPTRAASRATTRGALRLRRSADGDAEAVHRAPRVEGDLARAMRGEAVARLARGVGEQDLAPGEERARRGLQPHLYPFEGRPAALAQADQD